MSKIFLIFLCAFSFSSAQKCSYILDDKNVFKTVRCINMNSMNDVADEIRGNWSSLQITNRATNTHFSNAVANVAHLNVIQTLDLSRVGKLVLSDAGFRDYDSLKNLDISSAGITALKSSWFSKKTIEVLTVSENLIKALKKEEMKFFTRLRIFNASFNEIKTVEPNSFLESKKLEIISLSNNQIAAITIENMENLKHLYLVENAIVTVWANSFQKNNRLETLNLAENMITGIVDRSFSTLESLKYLNLSNNKLPHVGPWMFAGATKTKLAELDFSFNLITMLYPICLHDLPLLTFLDVSNNKIIEIFEKNFLRSTSLQTLYLCHNRINKIAPKSFEKLLALKTMDLSYNKLEAFTVEMFGGNVFNGNKLKKLNLSFNQLSTLNANLFALLVSLGTLDISGNKFTTLPVDQFKPSVNLQKLLLANNQIENLPDGFFNSLASLQELSIEGNRLTFIPDLKGPKKLLKATIGNNPWQCICLRETIIWLRQNRVQVDDSNFNSPFPSCVVVPEKSCIKDTSLIAPYQLQDKYSDAISAAEMEFGRKRFEL